MSECTDICWRAFSERAGITLGPVMPLLLGVGAMMRAVFRRLPRHDERLQDARLEAERLRQDHFRVVRGGHG